MIATSRRLLGFVPMFMAFTLALTCVTTARATELTLETPELVLTQSNSNWTATLYATAAYKTGPQDEMRLNNGDTLYLHPGQKACVAFIIGDDNLDHNLTPLAGWHDTITNEYGQIVKEMGDLSKLGFEVRSGTLEELGYNGRLTNDHADPLPSNTFLIEIDPANLPAGTSGSLRYYLYPYEGSDFWSDFASGRFKFSDEPSPEYTYFLNVEVVAHEEPATKTTKATLSKNGSVTKTCTACGQVLSKTTIYRPKTFTLSRTSFVYNGKPRNPALTVTDAKGKAIAASNYVVAYSRNTNVGTARAKVTFKGKYSGTKTISYAITKAANPLKVEGKVAKVAYAKVKAATQKLSVYKVLSFAKKSQGTMSYAKASGNKGIAISAGTGKVSVKKGLAKGTYKVVAKVKAAGTANYKATTKTVTFRIKVQ